jgi:hypothetical protein
LKGKIVILGCLTLLLKIQTKENKKRVWLPKTHTPGNGSVPPFRKDKLSHENSTLGLFLDVKLKQE